MTDITQWDIDAQHMRSLRLQALRETLVDHNVQMFTQYVTEMNEPRYHQGLSEALVLAVCRNQKWAAEILLSNPHCSPNFKNALAIQEASKDKNLAMVEFLYPLCNVDVALTDMKMMDAPHLYETLENYDLKVRLNNQVKKFAPENVNKRKM